MYDDIGENILKEMIEKPIFFYCFKRTVLIEVKTMRSSNTHKIGTSGNRNLSGIIIFKNDESLSCYR